MQQFRGVGGVQSYPSQIEDSIPVDSSTGWVGLGVAITAFTSQVQDYLLAHGQLKEADVIRTIALMSDAELGEGNICECFSGAYRREVRNF
jgi:pyruvate dehydrogenase E1 component